MKIKLFLLGLLLTLTINAGVNEFHILVYLPSPVPITNFHTVTVTTYTVNTNNIDSIPVLTASGFQLDSLPKRFKIIAISRDLQNFYKFGDLVKITNAGVYNGVYIVRDLMGTQWRNKIDILINPNDIHTKLFKVKLFKFIK